MEVGFNMKLKDRILDDWKHNWGQILSTIGLFVMVGLVSYNAGVTNGQVALCQEQNTTLVKDNTGHTFCLYYEPQTEVNTLINMEALNGIQFNTLQ